MLPRVIPTNQDAALNAAVLGRAKSEVMEALTDQPERCTRQFALSVAKMLWFPSGPVATSQSTVATASAQ